MMVKGLKKLSFCSPVDLINDDSLYDTYTSLYTLVNSHVDTEYLSFARKYLHKILGVISCFALGAHITPTPYFVFYLNFSFL